MLHHETINLRQNYSQSTFCPQLDQNCTDDHGKPSTQITHVEKNFLHYAPAISPQSSPKSSAVFSTRGGEIHPHQTTPTTKLSSHQNLNSPPRNSTLCEIPTSKSPQCDIALVIFLAVWGDAKTSDSPWAGFTLGF